MKNANHSITKIQYEISERLPRVSHATVILWVGSVGENVKERLIQLRAWLLVAACARQTFKALDATSANQATGIYNQQMLMDVKLVLVVLSVPLMFVTPRMASALVSDS